MNCASSTNTVIVGGVCNSNSSCYGFIGAGLQNNISGYEGADSIVGGKNNRIVGTYGVNNQQNFIGGCLLYTSPSPRDRTRSRMPSSA